MDIKETDLEFNLEIPEETTKKLEKAYNDYVKNKDNKDIIDKETFNFYMFKLGLIKKELELKEEEINKKTIELKELNESIINLESELKETLNLLN